MQQKKRKRDREYSEELWPRRRKRDEANRILAQSHGACNLVESIVMGEISYTYVEHVADFNLYISHHMFEITSSDTTMHLLPCHDVPDDPSFWG